MGNMKIKTIVLGMALGCLLTTDTAKADLVNLVENGGFEQGFDHWIQIIPGLSTVIGSDYRSGSHSASLGPFIGMILQPGVAEAGKQYELSFSTRITVDTPTLLYVNLGGLTGSLVDAFNPALDSTGKPATAWKDHTYTFTPGSSGLLSFLWFGNCGNLHLDDVTLTAVPEPATLLAGALLLIPFGISTLRIVRRR
jgi:hypothetical protein